MVRSIRLVPPTSGAAHTGHIVAWGARRDSLHDSIGILCVATVNGDVLDSSLPTKESAETDA
jgi:hypothetical protein